MKKLLGFTLTELVLVIAIVGILASLALPSYSRYITRARRKDAQTALLDLAARMERFFSSHQTYATARIASGDPSVDILARNKTPEGWYALSITAQNSAGFTLQATPIKAQTNDTECGNFTFNHLGQRGISGNAAVDRCW